jgi:LacI family transcriptional regulator
MAMALVTIAEIADRAQVSRSTVVRALNKKGYVSADKRALIESVAEELGYVPNKIAQGLKTQSSKMIGHIMPSSYPNPFFAQISNSIENAARRLGYSVLTMITDRDIDREKGMIEDLLGRMVDGIVFTSTFTSDPIRKVADLKVPIVMIERADDMDNVDAIMSKDQDGSLMATTHLIERGHRHIAYIGHRPIYQVEKNRMAGFAKAMKLHFDRSELSGCMELVDQYTPEEGYDAVKRLFARDSSFSALFVGSDILAVGVMQYFYEKRIRVPDDISVIGFDNTYSVTMAPQLTTVALPVDVMGRKAVEIIHNRTTNPDARMKRYRLSPELLERDSVRNL